MDAEGLVARTASVSFIARPEEERAGVLERVRALAPAGTFEFFYVTRVFLAHKASTSRANSTTSSPFRATSDQTA